MAYRVAYGAGSAVGRRPRAVRQMVDEVVGGAVGRAVDGVVGEVVHSGCRGLRSACRRQFGRF